MNKIDMTKKYRTRSGLSVRVLCVDLKNPTYSVLALVLDGDRELCVFAKSNGDLFAGNDVYGLVEVTPWSDLKIDDKVAVRASELHNWRPRYFAGLNEHGVPQAFTDGATSFSNEGCVSNDWTFCEPWDDAKHKAGMK